MTLGLIEVSYCKEKSKSQVTRLLGGYPFKFIEATIPNQKCPVIVSFLFNFHSPDIKLYITVLYRLWGRSGV